MGTGGLGRGVCFDLVYRLETIVLITLYDNLLLLIKQLTTQALFSFFPRRHLLAIADWDFGIPYRP